MRVKMTRVLALVGLVSLAVATKMGNVKQRLAETAATPIVETPEVEVAVIEAEAVPKTNLVQTEVPCSCGCSSCDIPNVCPCTPDDLTLGSGDGEPAHIQAG